jgi:hypothetical protein
LQLKKSFESASVLIISFFPGLLIHFSSVLEEPGIKPRGGRGRPGENSIINTLAEVFISSMVAFGTFIINYFIIRPQDSSIKSDIKRILAAIYCNRSLAGMM